jgi:hypothetical protein
VLLIAGLAAASTVAAAPPPTVQAAADDWLMIVKTKNLDPAREADFNRWYDDIDIPDVLQVPGYMRARRGARIASYRPTLRKTDAGDTYVAAYDIRSPDIDKTIIDMLMASWRMDQIGRSTDLIKVVERVYYHRYAPPVAGPAPGASDRYLYLQRFDCCSRGAARARFDRWYQDIYLAELGRSEAFTRATRYELYRVLMHEPHEAPGLLTLFEISAGSRDEAIARATRIDAFLASMPQGLGATQARDSGLYRVIKEAP